MFAIAPVLVFLLVLVALVDIIIRADDQVKHLPKLVWVLLVVFLPILGSILWFAVGREYAARTDRGTFGDPRRYSRAETAPVGHVGRLKSTEEQLAELDEEIERYNAQARIAQLEAELKKRRDSPDVV